MTQGYCEHSRPGSSSPLALCPLECPVDGPCRRATHPKQVVT